MSLLAIFFVNRSRICPYDVVIVTTPMYEKKHWDGDLADLTGQCVKVGHEMFDLFERSTTPIRTLEHYDRLSYFKTNLLLILNEQTLFFTVCKSRVRNVRSF